MHVNKAKVINCLIPSLVVGPRVLWILFSLMFGVVLPHLLDVLNIMFPSLMIIASSLGFT